MVSGHRTIKPCFGSNEEAPAGVDSLSRAINATG